MSSPIVIPVAHDFTCPWCYIGMLQVDALRREFDVVFDWLGYELFPEPMPYPEPAAPVEPVPNKPKTPSRFQLATAAQGIEMPSVQRPKHMRVHNALEAIEYVKQSGDAFDAIERLYRAYWEEGLEINAPEVLRNLIAPFVADVDDCMAAVMERRFASKIVPFDDEAYAQGVFNVPTFWIGGERYAEQPTLVLRKALSQLQ